MKRLKALTILRPHGVKGDVKAKVFLENMQDLGLYAFHDDAGNRVKVRFKGEHKGLAILHLSTIGDRTAAEAAAKERSAEKSPGSDQDPKPPVSS